MDFKNYYSLSHEYKEQIACLVNIWRDHLGEELVGVYLHGSLAQGFFKEGRSDIDVLVVVSRPILRNERIAIADDIIKIDALPAHLEMSAVEYQAMHPWHSPVICQFHYSDFWTERYKKSIAGEPVDNYVVDNDFPDSDITSYIAMINKCGVVLYGEEIEKVFPQIPDDDFWKSISADIDDYSFDDYNPRYFASNILILGRILSFKVTGSILSKYESGVWMREYVPDKYKEIVFQAFDSWFNDMDFIRPEQNQLDGLRDYLVSEIKKYL